MSEPIPAAELAAFREVVNQATPGPWFSEITRFDITTTQTDAGFRHVVVNGYDDETDEYHIDTPETREFIAQSREMCWRLLDEVDRLREKLEYSESQANAHIRHLGDLECVIAGTMQSVQMKRDCIERCVAEKFESLRSDLARERAKVRQLQQEQMALTTQDAVATRKLTQGE